ncbi:MAG: hypothetical protein CVT94_14140 [Bacteroidetes bacterium HGW-Bacteroidetes-11]|nr:MAG: hypothetical protein CVT94_14140 [Bacteroidetes bacterium HGW-Bacteroidetes-11]
MKPIPIRLFRQNLIARMAIVLVNGSLTASLFIYLLTIIMEIMKSVKIFITVNTVIINKFCVIIRV